MQNGSQFLKVYSKIAAVVKQASQGLLERIGKSLRELS